MNVDLFPRESGSDIGAVGFSPFFLVCTLLAFSLRLILRKIECGWILLDVIVVGREGAGVRAIFRFPSDANCTITTQTIDSTTVPRGDFRIWPIRCA
jgi:hypothetical protein